MSEKKELNGPSDEEKALQERFFGRMSKLQTPMAPDSSDGNCAESESDEQHPLEQIAMKVGNRAMERLKKASSNPE